MNDTYHIVVSVILLLIAFGLIKYLVLVNNKRKERMDDLRQINHMRDELEEAMYKALSIPKKDYFNRIASIRRIEEEKYAKIRLSNLLLARSNYPKDIDDNVFKTGLRVLDEEIVECFEVRRFGGTWDYSDFEKYMDKHNMPHHVIELVPYYEEIDYRELLSKLQHTKIHKKG